MKRCWRMELSYLVVCVCESKLSCPGYNCICSSSTCRLLIFPIATSLISESRDCVHPVSDFSRLILQCQECSSLQDRLGQMAKDSSATKYFEVPSYVKNCLES